MRVVGNWIHLISAAGGLLLTGCSHAPRTGEAGFLQEPPIWTAGDAGGGAVADGWVGTWGDPDLETLLGKVASENRDLKVAAARMRATLASTGIERAQGIPALDVTAGAARARQNSGEQPIVQTGNRFNLGLTLSWEVDVWGRLADLRQAARADASQAVSTYEAARLSLLVAAARAWFNLQATSAQLELARETHVSFHANAERARKLFERGTGPALDAALLETQADSALANIHSLEAQLDSLQRQIKVLCGEYPDDVPLPAVRPTVQLPSPIPAGLPSDLLSRRPDLLGAEAVLAGAEQRARAAVKRRLPGFSLTASAGTASPALKSLTHDEFSVWNIAGNLTAPLFQAGRITRAIEAARAQYELALAAYEQTALTAFREVETALANESRYRDRLTALQAAAESAGRAEQLAADRYRRGLVPVVTFLESQRRSLEARSSLIVARNEYNQNRLSLLLALGGDPFEH